MRPPSARATPPLAEMITPRAGSSVVGATRQQSGANFDFVCQAQSWAKYVCLVFDPGQSAFSFWIARGGWGGSANAVTYRPWGLSGGRYATSATASSRS